MARIQVKLLKDCNGPSLVGKAGDVLDIDSRVGFAGLAEPYTPPKPKRKTRKRRVKKK